MNCHYRHTLRATCREVLEPASWCEDCADDRADANRFFASVLYGIALSALVWGLILWRVLA